MADKSLEEILNPGTAVEIKRNGAVVLTAKVYEVGVEHLRKYPAMIGGAIAVLVTLGVKKGGPGKPIGPQYLTGMLPYVLANMTPLIVETTKLEPAGAIAIEKLPHHDLAEIAKAWMIENFGTEEKWGPWVAVADQVTTAMLKQDMKIWETVRKILSEQVTDSKTSSTAQLEPVPASLIEGGASES